MPRLTKTQREMYREFIGEFPFCWACEIEPLPQQFKTPNWYHGTLNIESAHIVGGPSRRADRRCIVRLCKYHHGAQEGLVFRPTRDTPLVRKLTIQNMLWLKRKYDPEFYDVEYIQGLRIKHAEVLTPEPFGERK